MVQFSPYNHSPHHHTVSFEDYEHSMCNRRRAKYNEADDFCVRVGKKKPQHIPVELLSDQLAIVGNSNHHQIHDHSHRYRYHTYSKLFNGSSDECNNKDTFSLRQNNNGYSHNNHSKDGENEGKIKKRNDSNKDRTVVALQTFSHVACERKEAPPLLPSVAYRKHASMKT